MTGRTLSLILAGACTLAPAVPMAAQAAQSPGGAAAAAAGTTPAAAPRAINPDTGLAVPPGYVIGSDDILTVTYWKDKDMSSDAVVRPDGKISLPLLNDIQAAGLTPEQLRTNITTAATQFVDDPTVSVIIKQINSRKVFITGQVGKPGTYNLSQGMTVLQLIALAGGVNEYAKKDNIVLIRGTERRPDGSPWSYRINYFDLANRMRLQQNLELKPGDTVMVP